MTGEKCLFNNLIICLLGRDHTEFYKVLSSKLISHMILSRHPLCQCGEREGHRLWESDIP